MLVTTDVLQEGEDLHTFCRRVVHYGIAWTPSAMEQRTGRVDRIGSLVQRRLDGRGDLPPDGTRQCKIGVYYPHLDPRTTAAEELRELVLETAVQADRLEELVLGRDADAEEGEVDG